MTQNKKTGILILVAVVVCLIGTGVFLMKSNQNKETKTIPTIKKTVTPSTSTSSSLPTNTSSSTEEDPETIMTKRIEKDLQNMTLEEKVGQLFLGRVPETNQIEIIQQYHLGGYLLFGRDMVGETRNSLKEKIASYQRASHYPMLIASDEEGGTVSRLSRGSQLIDERFPSPQELYNQNGWEGIRLDIEKKATIFQYYGIHTGLAPIADVSTDPSSFIYDRTIGLDKTGTAKYVAIVVNEMKKHALGSTLKHFPGYGNNQDSHVDVVTDTRSLEELRNNDLLPFREGIKANADSILVSHTIVTSVDPSVPASISKPIHEMIRNELGFNGVIMTDDMDMKGLADFIGQKEAGLLALESGNDLILSSSYEQQIPYIIEMVHSGQFDEEKINEAVTRVLRWKYHLTIMK